MANWYYYSKAGEKVGPVSATSLKELARQGLITPETKVENQNGRTDVAGQINGLTFAETKQPDTPVYGFDNGFNFSELTSEGQTPDGFDPFANAAPVTPLAHPPTQILSTFTKPVVLVPVSACGEMVLMLLIMLAFSAVFGNTKEKANVKDSDVSNKSSQESKTKQLFAEPILKKPFPEEAYLQGIKQKTKELIKDDISKRNDFDFVSSFGIDYAEVSSLNHVQLAKSSWAVTNEVYVILSENKNEELLEKIVVLQKCYDICVANIATQWKIGIEMRDNDWFGPDIALSQVVLVYDSNNCYHNLDQVMTGVTDRIKPLDKTKYVNTIKV